MVFQFIFFIMRTAHPYLLFNLRNCLRETKSQLCINHIFLPSIAKVKQLQKQHKNFEKLLG